MKPQHFAILAAAATVSLVAAIGAYTASMPWSLTSGAGAKLFPSLAGDSGKIARVEISQGSTSVNLKRQGDTWVLPDRGDFPANLEMVRAFLVGVSEAKLAEPKTRRADRYALLELEDPQSKGASSHLVRLLDDKGQVLAEAIVGKTRVDAFGARKGGTYVRKPGDEQAWLADTPIAAGSSARDWLNPVAFDTPAEKIAKVTITVQGEPAYTIDRATDASTKLTEIPAGKKLKYANSLDNILDAVATIDFEDVRKAEGTMDANAGTVTLEADKGLKAEFKLRREKDYVWIAISATGDGDSKKTADQINARTKGYEFKILPSKAEAMLKKRDTLLEDSSS